MSDFRKAEKLEKQGIDIFYISSDLDETNVDEVFDNIHIELGDFTNKKVIFNLSGLKYINSKTLGYISELCFLLEEVGGKIAICQCDEHVIEILGIIGTDYYSFSILKTEEDAINQLLK